MLTYYFIKIFCYGLAQSMPLTVKKQCVLDTERLHQFRADSAAASDQIADFAANRRTPECLTLFWGADLYISRQPFGQNGNL